MKKIIKVILVGAFLLKLVAPAFTDEKKFNIWGYGDVFKLTPLTDGILLGTGVALSGGDLLLDNVLEMNRQEYKGKIYNKNDVNSFDRRFMNAYSKTKDKAADITVAMAMATPAFVAFSTDKEEWFTEAVMYAETLLIANGIKEMTKLCVNRIRPYMYYDSEDWPEDDVKEGDFANSFPSGHSAMAFAAATFTSYTFWKYNPDSNWKYAVAGTSYALAGTTFALRLLSGNHFMTDAVSGALIGTGVGFLVPWIHTFNTNHKDFNVALSGNGICFKVKI